MLCPNAHTVWGQAGGEEGRFLPLFSPVKSRVPLRWWSGSGTVTFESCMETWPIPTATSSAAWRSSLPSPAPRCLVSLDPSFQAKDGEGIEQRGPLLVRAG